MEDQIKKSMIEELSDMYQDAVENPNLMSFSDLQNMDRSGDVMEELGMLHTVAHMIICNITDYSPDKITAAKKLVREYTDMANAIFSEYEGNSNEEEKEIRKSLLERLYDSFFSKEKKYKTEGGVKYPASDFLYVPDSSKPSTWKLRIAEGKPGNVTVAQLGRAAAAFSSGGFRGNKVQLPGGSSGSVKAKLRSWYKKLGVKEEDIPESVKKESPLMLFKSESGELRWFARYSNNYRDDDNPAEIISKESHMRFVEMVDKGQAPMPELWHWHIPGTAWGKADWLAYDEDNGIAMASGYILPGHEKEAEAFFDLDLEIGVSHGMPAKSIRRDSSDDSIIVEHITREISDLPLWAAANKLTSIAVLKETDQMAIPKQKKEYLKPFISEEVIEQIESGNEALAKLAKQTGIESKEQSDVVDEVPASEEEESDGPGDLSVKEDTPEPTPTIQVESITKEEVASAIVDLMKPLYDQIKQLTDQVEALIQAKEKSVETPTEVPTASLAALIAKQFGSAIGDDGAAVRKNSNLAKSGPNETPVVDEQNIVSTGNPIIDSVISGVIGRK